MPLLVGSIVFVWRSFVFRDVFAEVFHNFCMKKDINLLTLQAWKGMVDNGRQGLIITEKG